MNEPMTNSQELENIVEKIINSTNEGNDNSHQNLIVPKRNKFFCLKINLFAFIIVSFCSLAIITTIIIILMQKQNIITQNKNEINSLSSALKSTEEGKKLLEGLNANLDKKAQDAQSEAKNAQDEAKNANEKYTNAQNELNAKLAEVSKVTNELNSKKSELAKAQRGISKFAELETLFNKYATDAEQFTGALSDGYGYILNNQSWEFENITIPKLNSLIEAIEDDSKKINNLFDTIENGTY